MKQRVVTGLFVLAVFVGTWFGGRHLARRESEELARLSVVVPPPAELAPSVHAILKSRMQRHGSAALRLVGATLSVDYKELGRAAGEIADEPRIAWVRGEDEALLNSSLPEGFFQLQHELGMAAEALAATAARQDGQATAEALGRTMQACFACHAKYRAGRR